MKTAILIVLLSMMLLLTCSISFADSYGIILPDKPSRTMEQAGKELQKYLNLMTHTVVATGESAGKMDTVFILGDANPATGNLKVPEPTNWSAEKSDAYYLKSIRSGNRNYIILAGKSDVSTLYAIYEYLERYGGCGFFEDGDYVPSKAPKVTGVDYLTSPRFSFRHMRGDVCGAWGLKKFHYFHWKEDDWMRFYDWMAKRRLNASDYWPLAMSQRAGAAIDMAFGIKDDEPRELYGAGWPNTWSWPARQRTHILQHRLAYHRMLGIKAVMQVMYGLTPPPFKAMHPEFKWVPAGYEHAMIDPSDPASYEYTKKFLQAIVDLYGTDHYFNDTPYAEFLGADSYDKALEAKINAAKTDCQIFKEIDPQAIWTSDSWDFSAIPDFWTLERKEKYFKSVPNEMLIFEDACTDLGPQYQNSNYFFGVPWSVGALHSFQGDDHLHGNLQELIDRIQSAATGPNSDKLIGYNHLPEIHGHDIMYFQLSTLLSWNPKGVTLDKFISDYTRRRYGDASFGTMLKAQNSIVDAVYRGYGQLPIYKKISGWEMYYAWCPIWEKNYKNGQGNLTSLAKVVPSLRKGVETALTQEELQKSNPLYENDMVEWSKSYLGHLFNYYIIKSYQAFKLGNASELDRYSKSAILCLDEIQNILSTRQDYYLQNTIDQAMSVPGTNPFTPKMIKQNCVSWSYAPNDCYEQMYHYFKPRAELYFNTLKARLVKGENAMKWEDIAPEGDKIERKWVEQPITVPASVAFKGTPMEAVRHALAAVKPIGKIAAFKPGWKVDRTLTIECAAAPVNNGLEIVVVGDGPAKTEEAGGSLCWTLGPKSASAQPYLYISADDLLVYDVKGPAALTVEYLDEGQGELGVDYDSTDSKAAYGGAYKPLIAFKLTGTGQWKTAKIILPDAMFTDRENNGADLRLVCPDGSLKVRKVSLSPGK